MDGQEAPSRPRRRALAWVVIGAASALVLGSFALSSGDDAAAEKRAGPRAAPVSVAEVVRASITERGRYPGELDADAADVAAFYAGRLIAVKVRVGDTVAAGDVLAQLDPVDVQDQVARAQAQAAAAAADQKRVEVELEGAAAELARMEPLEGEIITTGQLDALRARAGSLRAAAATAAARGAEARAGVRLLQRQIAESVVRAPFEGRIAERYVDPGATVAAGTPLVRLVATSPLRVRFDVPSHEVEGLAPGTKVQVVTRIGAAPGAGSPATIRGIAGEVTRDRRVAAVEAIVDAPPTSWLPGMFAEAIVERRNLPDADLVPGAAVLSRMQPDGTLADGVFRLEGDRARWTPVTVVTREGDRVAVTSPEVTAGVRVLVAGHTDLADGSQVVVATPAAPPPGSAPAPSATP